MVFDSWYFASRPVRFLEREKKDWISEARSNRKIFLGGKSMNLRDYADSLKLRDMTAYSIGNNAYFMKSITTRMKNMGKVQVVISRGMN